MKQSRTQKAILARVLGATGLSMLALGAGGCHEEFDTSRVIPARGTVGEEVFGVLCDRVGAQALREDLTGESFRSVCHKVDTADFENTVNQDRLPALIDGATNTEGNPVSLADQQASRTYAIGRIEALARRRADLIAALDATFPDQIVPIKDLNNPDPKLSCNAPAESGEGKLNTELANLLGRFAALYNDGTLPQSTESLGRLLSAFKAAEDAQKAWSQFSSRDGYRPQSLAFGATRPSLAYKGLRDLSNASLSLLSADSKPYELEPKLDENGNRIPVPGAANAQFNALLAAAHAELVDAKANSDEDASALTVSVDAKSGRPLLSRRRDNIEFMESLFYAQNDAFGSGTSQYVVRRDPRGYAALAGGTLIAPFVDKDGDGLPDVNDVGQFVTSNGSVAPSPFSYFGAPSFTRDEFDRAVFNGKLIYDYIDTSKAFTRALVADTKALVNPDPAAKHETLMDALAGAIVLFGTRADAEKTYSSGPVKYSKYNPDTSPIVDLAYGIGVALSDRTIDDVLALSRSLFTDKEKDVARVVSAGLAAQENAKEHDEAKIPKNSVFWDEMLDVLQKVAAEKGLLEDLLKAIAHPDSRQLGYAYSRYSRFNDEISYDPNNLNGPAKNLTTNTITEMKTPVDRTKPATGKNRSAMQRFISLIADTTGVTSCNKEGAIVHAVGLPLLGDQDIPTSNAIRAVHPSYIGKDGFKECELFKFENLAAFYLDAIVANNPDLVNVKNPAGQRVGSLYMRDDFVRNGLPGGVGAANVDLMEASSGITGWWGTGTDLRPKPQWLNRLIFFDQKNDSPTSGGKNYKTNRFLADLNGPHAGTAVCPERVITDPMNDPMTSADGKVHGLRNCAEGDWLDQRGYATIFTWEDFGFYTAMTPMLSAFVKYKREDLFLELVGTINRHYSDENATANECKLAGGKSCTKDGIVTYEPLLDGFFAGDTITSLSLLIQQASNMSVKHCDVSDAKTGACTTVTNKTGIEVLANATRALLGSPLEKDAATAANALTDRKGNKTSLRNDGTTNPRVTPIYLILQALNSMDDAFDQYAKDHPDDADRKAKWKSARSQLVDQFLGTTGTLDKSAFSNAGFPKITPILIDSIRGQLLAHCPNSFAWKVGTNATEAPPECAWAKNEIASKMAESMGGPLFAGMMDVADALRKDDSARFELEKLLTYLLDGASTNEALASTLATMNDMVQLLKDRDNILLPVFHVLAQAAAPTSTNADGQVEKSLADAQTALLARLSGKYFDAEGVEICAKEFDPNQIISLALANLVTPMKTGPRAGQAPLDVFIDVIADVNRKAPEQAYGKLTVPDYANISDNIVDFLMNRERGLEQFYEVIRNGTK